MGDIKISKSKITIYTDSQNIIGLQRRRKRLESNNYYSRGNKKIKNHELYKKFYKMTDLLNCTFIKLEGHKKSTQKDKLDRIFTLVDRASREALRNSIVI